ncbi:MAG: MmgE/PrpD family protein [Candidatus Njordarchaeia archaeon]
MVDKVAENIAKFSTRIDYKNLDGDVIKEIKLRIIDSIGVAMGSIWSSPGRIARKALYPFKTDKNGARIWGTDTKLPPDHATLLNGLLVRYLDFNDTYLSKEPLHPSDMIPAIISIGETIEASGKEVMAAIAVAYEVGMTLCDCESLRARGWDHVNYTMIGATAGLSNLLKLTEEETINALAIAVVPHAAMRQTRAGKVTMWKASAASNACRNAVIAALLAKNGYEGPDQPFVGEMGMIKQMLNGSFDYEPIENLANIDRPRKMLESYMKFHPVEYHAQSAVDAVYQLLNEGVKADEIVEIEVGTVQATYDIIVKHPEKWNPETRETADHSLPYIIASGFVNGKVWIENFEGEEIKNPKTRELMSKMKVTVDDELDKLYPKAIPNKITVKLKDGKTLTKRVDYPTGHPGRKDDVENLVKDKFVKLTKNVLSEEQIKDLFNTVFKLENMDNIGEISEILIL